MPASSLGETTVSENCDRLRDALSAFLYTYKLEPFRSGGVYPEGEYRPTFRFFKSGDDTLQLQYQREAHEAVIRALAECYPGQLDRKASSRKLIDVAVDWIENERDPGAEGDLNSALEGLLRTIEEELKEYKVFIPIDGLEVEGDVDLDLGRATVHGNHEGSDLVRMAKKTEEFFGHGEEILSVFRDSPAYMTVVLKGHHQRVVEDGLDAAIEGLAVLRLYLGSYYLDVYGRPGVPVRMGIAGTIVRLDRSTLYIDNQAPMEAQIPGSSFSSQHGQPFNLTKESVQLMKQIGLSQINRHLVSSWQLDRDQISPRVHRALSWFAKGTSAANLADSYLMYAIAIESLLSEGRTPQETYALWTAALTSREADTTIYPLNSYVSTKFGRQLKNAADISQRFRIIRSRFSDLFSYRNAIAHGLVFDDEIEPTNLLDFETLVRSAILSFVLDGWKSIAELKQWVAGSTELHFDPAAK